MKLTNLVVAAFLLAGCASASKYPATGTAHHRATIYASPQAPALVGGTILVSGGQILAVGPADEVRIPPGYARLEARDQFAVAGYWNSHTHLVGEGVTDPLGASDAALATYFSDGYLKHGFTTILDIASETSLAIAVAERIQTSQINAPRLLTVGSPFYPPGGTPIYARPIYEVYDLPSAEIVDASSAAARLEAQADAGVRAVKLFTGAIVGEPIGVLPMDGSEVRILTETAHRRGLPVFAHPTDTAGLNVAVENGVDILAHAAPLSGAWDSDRASALAARGIGLTPTLRLFELFPHPSTPVDLAVSQAAALHEAGGDILFGTDAGFSPEYAPQGEWALMHRFMDWREILASMTTTPARRLGEGGKRGEIAPGQAADFVLLSADPALDYLNLGAVDRVLKQGRLVFGAE